MMKIINEIFGKQLNRKELKKIKGGGSLAGSCTGPLGGCDIGANCQRGGGGAGKCDIRNNTCGCF